MPVTLLAISLLADENITANRSRFVTRLLAVVKLLVFNIHTHSTHTYMNVRFICLSVYAA